MSSRFYYTVPLGMDGSDIQGFQTKNNLRNFFFENGKNYESFSYFLIKVNIRWVKNKNKCHMGVDIIVKMNCQKGTCSLDTLKTYYVKESGKILTDNIQKLTENWICLWIKMTNNYQSWACDSSLIKRCEREIMLTCP